MHYALIQNNIVAHVLRVPPSNIYPASIAEQYVACGEDVQIGWLAQGGGFVAPPALAKSPQELQAEIVAATQARLDTFARTRNYDGILSACTYASSAIAQFAGEGQAAVNARDQTWATLYTILGEVQAGIRPAPVGFADIEADLPVLDWPA